jgi:hypothetical protein
MQMRLLLELQLHWKFDQLLSLSKSSPVVDFWGLCRHQPGSHNKFLGYKHEWTNEEESLNYTAALELDLITSDVIL